MKLEYVTLYNAFSHKDTTVRLEGNGLCLVKGSNGAGKSSVVKGILFALFGVGADDVINNKVGKDTYVEVTGSDDKDTYVVRRYRKDTKHKNNLYFYINDGEIAAATNTALQEKLEAFIGCDYRSFITIASFSNDMMMFANATDSERKAIFEKILQDLDIYNDYHKTAKEKIVDLNTDVEDLDHSIDVDERELSVVKKVLETEETRALVLEQKRLDRLRELGDERTELEKKFEFSVRLKGKRERYNNAIFRLEQWLEKYKSKAEEIQDTDTELYMLDQKEGDLSFDTCPVCGTKMTEKHRDKEMKVITKRRKELNKKMKKLEDYEFTRAMVTDSMNRLFDKVSAIDYKLVKYDSVVKVLGELDEKIVKAQDQVGDSQDGIRLWKSKIRKLSKTIASAKKRITGYEEELLYWKEVAHGFSKQGIPNIIITRALTLLESCANGYLDTLTSGAMGIQLTGMTKTKKGAVRNKIGINVVSESGVTSFGSYSGGERQRLNIALLLALRDVAEHNKGIKLNCLFLDEVLDLSLDEEGIEEVLQLLRVKKRAVDSIIVITPKQQMLHNTGVTFDTVMHVEKQAGFSSVEIKESL
jgi:DNA repair exonuclease SbcCD ATPase subunit